MISLTCICEFNEQRDVLLHIRFIHRTISAGKLHSIYFRGAVKEFLIESITHILIAIWNKLREQKLSSIGPRLTVATELIVSDGIKRQSFPPYVN